MAGILARLPGQVLFIAWTTAMLGQGGVGEILSTSMGTVTRYNVTCKLSLSLSVNPDTLLQALLQLQ